MSECCKEQCKSCHHNPFRERISKPRVKRENTQNGYIRVGVTKQRTINGGYLPSEAVYVKEQDFEKSGLQECFGVPNTQSGLCCKYTTEVSESKDIIAHDTGIYRQVGIIAYRTDEKQHHKRQFLPSSPLYIQVDKLEKSGLHKSEEQNCENIAEFFSEKYKEQEQRKKP